MNNSRKFFLLFSTLLIIAGIFLCIETNRIALVHLVSELLGLQLDEHFRSAGFFYVASLFILLGIIGLLNLLRSAGKLSESRFYSLTFLLLIVHYFFHLSGNAINYPVYDDKGALLDFLLKYKQASTWSEKTSLLFLPYNE